MCNITYDRIKSLIKENKTTAKKVLSDLELNAGFLTDMNRRGTSIAANTTVKFAAYFNVSADYLLGKTDDSSLPGELVIPNVMKDVPVAFNRGEFEGLTQNEVDLLAAFAQSIKEKRQN